MWEPTQHIGSRVPCVLPRYAALGAIVVFCLAKSQCCESMEAVGSPQRRKKSCQAVHTDVFVCRPQRQAGVCNCTC